MSSFPVVKLAHFLQHADYFLQVFLVDFVKICQFLAVDVQQPDELLLLSDGDYDFGLRF